MDNITDNIDLNNYNNYKQKKCFSFFKVLILLTLPTLILALVILAYLNIIPLKMELHSVILIGFIYFIYLFFVKHNAYYASCKFISQNNTLKSQLNTYIDNNLLTLGETTKANGDIDDFLQEFTSNLRNTNFSSIASGIFPTLGILGTFISIALSMPDFSNGASGVLENEITKLLGGVGTAFYVSIYGIFLSLWWTFFEKIGMSRFEHTVFDIKEKTKSNFWTKLDIESIHLQSSIKNNEKIATLFEQITSKDLVENINSSLSQRAKLVEHIIYEEKLLAQNIKDNLENFDKLFNLIKMMTLNIQTNMQKLETQKDSHIAATEVLTQTITKLNNTLSKVDDTNVKEIYENVLNSIHSLDNQTKKISQTFSQNLEDYDNNLSESLEKSLESIDKQTVKIIQDLEEFKEIKK